MLEWRLIKKVFEDPRVNVKYSLLPLCLANIVYWNHDSDDDEEGQISIYYKNLSTNFSYC